MEKITTETENKIKENNHTITVLLDRNENLYLSELSDSARRIFPVGDDDKIQIPNNYIRKKEDFVKKYALENITKKYQHKSNIAYLMQYGDLMQYFFTRFNVFGPLKKVHFYYEIINLATILEIILRELAQSYRNICSSCSLQKNCGNLINKEQIADLKKLLSRLKELKIISLKDAEINTLNELIDLRNKIHLRLMKNTIYNEAKFNTVDYNNYMNTFQILIKSINFSNISCSKE